MIRISKLGPICVEVPTGYIANVFPERRVTQRRTTAAGTPYRLRRLKNRRAVDRELRVHRIERRVATAQRRARGTWGSTKPGQRRRSKALGGFGLGRRADDAEAHRDRRFQFQTVWGISTRWTIGAPTRRKTDERRVNSRPYGYPWRRAPGAGTPYLMRRINYRRAGDKEAHQERRGNSPWIWAPGTRPRRRKGEDRRMMQRRAPSITFQWGGKRRATADRRAGPRGQRYKNSPDIGPLPWPHRERRVNIWTPLALNLRWCSGYPLRRKTDGRRTNHYTYKSSNDPRIVALERRKS